MWIVPQTCVLDFSVTGSAPGLQHGPHLTEVASPAEKREISRATNRPKFYTAYILLSLSPISFQYDHDVFRGLKSRFAPMKSSASKQFYVLLQRPPRIIQNHFTLEKMNEVILTVPLTNLNYDVITIYRLYWVTSSDWKHGGR